MMAIAWQPALARAVRRDARIERLIAAMSLEEKAGQLTLNPAMGIGQLVNPTPGAPSRTTLAEAIAAGAVGGIFNNFDPVRARAIQELAVKTGPRGIPLIFAGDIIHGFKTAFPVPLAEAASFDPELCRRTARETAIEAGQSGLHWTFAPMVDVARDQRWGRVVEGAGEDSWLGARIAEARVRGFQGDDLRRSDTLLACPKHFAAYGAVAGGMEYDSADIPETTLRAVHLPPFRAAVAAGALSIMSSFNDIAGVPATGNHHLLTDILRDEWGFAGLVVSDYESELELIAHGYAADEADAALKALTAGCDMAMASGLYLRNLPALVRGGRLPEATIDRAVRRVLGVKSALGLFDDPFRSMPAPAPLSVRRPEGVALAHEAACKSIVLLKNEGGVLPLAPGRRVALIGPFVEDVAQALGPWILTADTKLTVSLAAGVRAMTGADAPISVTPGCAAERPIDGGIDAAVAAARGADVVVLYLGETLGMSGEAASRTEITLPQAQVALAEAVAAVGKPLVVLLRHGRALALPPVVQRAAAIMCTWFLGSQSGAAIADTLYGRVAPQGRLPVSFPHVSGQEPYHYDRRSTGRAQTGPSAMFKARYREVPNTALYPFGHGLGYGDVVYGPTTAAAPTLAMAGAVTVQAALTNRGERAQHEVAQLYIHDRAASIVQPVRLLKGIVHVDIPPGESRTVSFRLTAADLAFVHADLATRADPGAFDVWIAPSAQAGQPVSVTLSRQG